MVKKDGMVSIVIPVYNGEKYITETVENILRSDYKNLEVLIVDDGSGDNSLALCEQLGQQDNRVTVFFRKHEGVVSARNYGVSKASGEYLCFCDQDDIVDKGCYSRQIEKMTVDNSEICMCSVGRIIDGKTSPFELSEDACYETDEILTQLLYPMLFNGFDVPVIMGVRSRYPHIWSCMFRMDFWKKNDFRFRVYVNFEDDLIVKTEALAKSRRVSTLAYTGYYWRVNLNSTTFTDRYIEDIAEKQQKVFDDLHRCIADRTDNKEVLGLLKHVTYCKQYLDAIHNIAYRKEKINRKMVTEYYNKNIYSRGFEECIKAVRYVKKDRIKPRIVLKILAKKRTMASCRAEKMLDSIMRITLRSQMLTRLERMLKGIRE